MKKLVFFHRTTGLFSAIFILLLSVTGIMLNHTEEIGMDGIAVKHPLVLSLYGMSEQTVEFRSVSVDESWVSQYGKAVFLNSHYLFDCDALSGAVSLPEQHMSQLILIACLRKLVIVNLEGELVERLDPLVPFEIGFLQDQGAVIIVGNESQQMSFDPLLLDFVTASTIEVTGEDRVLGNVQAQPPPEPYYSLIVGGSSRGAPSVSLERLMLDLHSGRIFGPYAVLVFDLVALGIIFLVLSGFYVWFIRRR